MTAHPYQYQTKPFGDGLTDGYQPGSYSDEFLRSVHAHGEHPNEQSEVHSNDRHPQEPASHKQTTQGFHSDDNYGTQSQHKTTTDYQQHHVSICFECVYRRKVFLKDFYFLYLSKTFVAR